VQEKEREKLLFWQRKSRVPVAFPRMLLRFTQMAARSEIRASIFSFPSP